MASFPTYSSCFAQQYQQQLRHDDRAPDNDVEHIDEDEEDVNPDDEVRYLI